MMNRLSEDQLVARLRHDLPRTDLLQAVTAGVPPHPPGGRGALSPRNEKRVADVVAFPVAAIADIGQPSEAELTKFYEANLDLFRAPEYRGFTLGQPVAERSAAGRPRSRKTSCRAEYEQRKDEFETPEQRQIQQILAPSEEKAKEAEAALAAGKEWKEVATDDRPGPGDDRTRAVEPQGDPARTRRRRVRTAARTQPSTPIKTPFGWHILRVVKIEPAATQTFEQAKATIDAELKLRTPPTGSPKSQPGRRRAGRRRQNCRGWRRNSDFKLMTVAAVDENGDGPGRQAGRSCRSHAARC